MAGALLTRDRLLMHELESITELEFLQVKNSLLVLIQHNLVSFIEEHPDGNPQDVQTYYQASVSFILWRLRFPRFLQVAKHRFGDEVCGAHAHAHHTSAHTRHCLTTGNAVVHRVASWCKYCWSTAASRTI